LVGPDQTPIKAHKYMLASASPVFYSMFEGPFAEKGEVIIPDIEREVFQGHLTIFTFQLWVQQNDISKFLQVMQ
jgi:hypothetical protein